MLSRTQELYQALKEPISRGHWINSLEVLYSSSATVVSLLHGHYDDQLNYEVVQFLHSLNRLLSTEEAHTKALSQMHSERWHVHGVPFFTRRALQSIYRELSDMLYALQGSTAYQPALRTRALIREVVRERTQ